MADIKKIGLGGGCHWCTEAVFSSVIGVTKVEQGWIASTHSDSPFSEAVLIHFDSQKIDLITLLNIHLHTHSSRSEHSMRYKYRSAIYTFDIAQTNQAHKALSQLQSQFKRPLITIVLPYGAFKINVEKYHNYYYQNPDRPFCQNYISGKIDLLIKQFPAFTRAEVKVLHSE